jgi:type 1 fimbriae regulatory protein FimB/type 1 fimbriae regulatory protein FimE
MQSDYRIVIIINYDIYCDDCEPTADCPIHHKERDMQRAVENCPENASSWDSQPKRREQNRGVLRLVTTTPDDVNGTVPPRRVSNADRRPREHLSQDEVKALMKAARVQSRYPDRDAAAIWLAYNHGLRVSELVALRWGDVRWPERKLTVHRLKGSRSGEHDLTETDLRMLGPLRKGRAGRPADHVFIDERGAAMTAAGFRKMLSRLSLPDDLAALAVHPHMLRHACGYDLAGRDGDIHKTASFLGHRRIDTTMRYRHLDAAQFTGLRD